MRIGPEIRRRRRRSVPDRICPALSGRAFPGLYARRRAQSVGQPPVAASLCARRPREAAAGWTSGRKYRTDAVAAGRGLFGRALRYAGRTGGGRPDRRGLRAPLYRPGFYSRRGGPGCYCRPGRGFVAGCRKGDRPGARHHHRFAVQERRLRTDRKNGDSDHGMRRLYGGYAARKGRMDAFHGVVFRQRTAGRFAIPADGGGIRFAVQDDGYGGRASDRTVREKIRIGMVCSRGPQLHCQLVPRCRGRLHLGRRPEYRFGAVGVRDGVRKGTGSRFLAY